MGQCVLREGEGRHSGHLWRDIGIWYYLPSECSRFFHVHNQVALYFIGHCFGMEILTRQSRIDWVGNLTVLQLGKLLFHIFENLKKNKTWNKENNHRCYSATPEVTVQLCVIEWVAFSADEPGRKECSRKRQPRAWRNVAQKGRVCSGTSMLYGVTETQDVHRNSKGMRLDT